MRFSFSLLIFLLAAPLYGAPAPGDGLLWIQDISEEKSQDAPEAATPEPPSDVLAAVALLNKLKSRVAALEDGKARALLQAYLDLAVQQSTELDEAERAALGSPERDQQPSLRADLGTLTSGAERISALLTERGLDVAFAQETLVEMRKVLSSASEFVDVPKTRAAALDIKVEVLRATLRPLTRDETQQRLESWMLLLRGTCLEVRNMEIASLTAAAEESGLRYQERSVLLRQERSGLVARVNAVISALEKKGGDAEEANAYLDSIVAVPPITGVKAAMTTALTWLTSPGGGIAVGINIASAILILLFFFVASRLLGRITRRTIGRVHNTSGLLREFLVTTIRRGTLIVGALAALSMLGVNMGPLLAAIGAAGLVIGLALQGTLGNLASGLMIMIFRPFDVNDVVDTGGASGKVLGMSLMTTTVRTFDNRTVFVPNSMIWGDIITNVTANTTRRIDMTFGIAYEDDVALAQEILEGVLMANNKILDDPAPLVRLHELADSSVNFIVRPWAKTADYWDVYWEVTASVKAEFGARGISIPYPQRDLHIIAPKDAAESSLGLDMNPKSTKEAQQEVPADD